MEGLGSLSTGVSISARRALRFFWGAGAGGSSASAGAAGSNVKGAVVVDSAGSGSGPAGDRFTAPPSSAAVSEPVVSAWPFIICSTS